MNVYTLLEGPETYIQYINTTSIYFNKTYKTKVFVIKFKGSQKTLLEQNGDKTFFFFMCPESL